MTSELLVVFKAGAEGGEAGGGCGSKLAKGEGVAEMEDVLGTIVGGEAGGEQAFFVASDLLAASAAAAAFVASMRASCSLEADDHGLGGEVGLSDDEDSGETSEESDECFVAGDGDGALPPAGPWPRDCCMRQWILNQLDLLP